MKRILIERNRYFDSVFLMRISYELKQLPGVNDATVAMGTSANLESLEAIGFAIDESASAIHANDLVIAIDAATGEAIERANDHLQRLLAGPTGDESGSAGALEPMSIAEAIRIDPDLNLALVSVPGAYAAREARQALRKGLHVMLFSDNVSAEEETALKDDAIGRGLLMMGPDCGTAILNGIPLGFANVVRRGSIGIVGASGTGIQEISSLIHRLGGGISQAIGTGGRDLSVAVGARMTLFGIDALSADPQTTVIVVVSKAPDPTVADRVVEALRAARKPGVVHFVSAGTRRAAHGISFAGTLAEAAQLSCRASGIKLQGAVPANGKAPKRLAPRTGRVAGYYCGGTLAQEAWNVLHRAGLVVRSNVAADPALKIEPGAAGTEHIIWDLGDDAFTVGKPHPMIEPSLRDNEVARAAEDPSVDTVLVDCVLGYGAHPNPAGSLADAARRAIEAARANGRDLLIVASVTGTDNDPQNLSRQVTALTDAGVLVAPSNAEAARWIAGVLQGGDE